MALWADTPKEGAEDGWGGRCCSPRYSRGQAAVPPAGPWEALAALGVYRPLRTAAVGGASNTNDPRRRGVRLYGPRNGRADDPACPALPGCGGPRPEVAASSPAQAPPPLPLSRGRSSRARRNRRQARPLRTRPGVACRKRKRPAPGSGARAVVGRPLLPLRVAARVMAAAALPPLPPQFKSIQHHLRTAQELDKREPVVAYYCE